MDEPSSKVQIWEIFPVVIGIHDLSYIWKYFILNKFIKITTNLFMYNKFKRKKLPW